MGQTDQDDLIHLLDEDEQEVDIPVRLPLLPVRDVVIFTDMLLPLFIGRDRSVRAVEEAMNRDRYMFVSAQNDLSIEDPTQEQIYRVGTICRILRMLKLPDGRVKALVQGIAKARIVRYLRKRSYYRVLVNPVSEDPPDTITLEVEAMMRNVREQCEKILAYKGEFNDEVAAILEGIEDPGKLADLVASNLKLKVEESQELLELFDPMDRLRKVNDLIARELDLSAMQAKIQSDVKDEISKNQRDYFLREQVRAIYKELGDMDDKGREMEEYKKRIKKAKMPKDAADEAQKQLRRLEQMHMDSAESTVVRSYLDWLVDLPWTKSSKDVMDIRSAKKVLEEDHFGLEQVKDRILEYLSVRKLNPRMKGPILCFVGPPGVGKTSLGRSIAKATGRKFIRISLGGIHDEAEIRGHRRTYIGAMPGRIIQGLKQCKTNNPVFMMDEIDKLGYDFRGDPSSALLEALDPEQNRAFSDHYINLPFDVSKVLFILTANMTDTIPSALLDRMEIISFSGYTQEEKVKIAQTYLIPRQVKENGIKKAQLRISAAAMVRIINEHTSESGLRELERKIGAICRKTARHLAEGKKGPFAITGGNLEKYLGPAKYFPEMDQEESQVGLSTGLAWTHVGGEVLYVEASLISGKGELIITGQIGEVMQESARAALSYARAYLQARDLTDPSQENVDIHIHVPAGAIPKDGPSAGIAMACALISVLVQRPVKSTVAMTGEISLRGRVLPIGGLKEKALGALRAGITTIVIPEKNRNDLKDMPANVKRKIQFIPVTHMDQVLDAAFEEAGEPPAGKNKEKPAKKGGKKPDPKKGDK